MAKQTSGKVAAPAADVAGVTHLRVRSLVHGFRRAGRAWPAADVTVPIDGFTAEQIEQLMAEPMLTVLPVAAGKAG